MAQRSRRTVHRIVKLTEKQWDRFDAALRGRGWTIDLALADRVAKQVANGPFGAGRVRLTESQWEQACRTLRKAGKAADLNLAEKIEGQIAAARASLRR